MSTASSHYPTHFVVSTRIIPRLGLPFSSQMFLTLWSPQVLTNAWHDNLTSIFVLKLETLVFAQLNVINVKNPEKYWAPHVRNSETSAAPVAWDGSRLILVGGLMCEWIQELFLDDKLNLWLELTLYVVYYANLKADECDWRVRQHCLSRVIQILYPYNPHGMWLRKKVIWSICDSKVDGIETCTFHCGPLMLVNWTWHFPGKKPVGIDAWFLNVTPVWHE